MIETVLCIAAISTAFGFFVGRSYYSSKLALALAEAEHYEFMAKLYIEPRSSKTGTVEHSPAMGAHATVNKWTQ